jgi:hypothetical protein
MQPSPIGQVAPERRGQPGKIHHANDGSGIRRAAGRQRQQHRQHAALHHA